MKNIEKLEIAKQKFGDKVVCTNGLLHIIEDSREEIYIRDLDFKRDERTRYKTLEVTDDSVIAYDLKSGNTYLIDKGTLEYRYKTKNEIKSLKGKLFEVRSGEASEIIDNTGKTVIYLRGCIKISKLFKNIYLVSSKKMFSDKLLMIGDDSKVKDMTDNKRYRIKLCGVNKIRVEVMHDGEYIFDLSSKKCYNTFRQQFESSTSLFN